MIKIYKIIIAVCFVAILCNIVIKTYIIDKQANQISILQKFVSAERSFSGKRSDKLVKKVSTEQHDIKRIFHKIPDEWAFTEYAVNIRTIIDDNNLVIEDSLIFQPEETKQFGLLKYNTIVTAGGTYAKIKKLISDIQNMSGLVNFNSASITRDKETQNTLTIKFKLSIFFKRDQHEI